MRKAIETLKNIWKIEDLRQRILITILFVAIYRFGSYVVLPGINPAMLAKLHEQTSEGLLALLNMFSGGAFSNASIFALGIMPYISASIVIQLLGIAVPYFQKLQREGESGRRKMNQYTRYLTIAILLVQAPSYLLNLKMQAGPSLNASLDWVSLCGTRSHRHIRAVISDHTLSASGRPPVCPKLDTALSKTHPPPLPRSIHTRLSGKPHNSAQSQSDINQYDVGFNITQSGFHTTCRTRHHPDDGNRHRRICLYPFVQILAKEETLERVSDCDIKRKTIAEF